MDPMCPDLTRAEFTRLLDKDLRSGMDLAIRVSRRYWMLKEGHKRVPKHRKNKKGPTFP